MTNILTGLKWLLARRQLFLLLSPFCFSIGSQGVNANEIRVAVAANFYPVMMEIAESFEQKTGHDVSLISGSSGKLVAQITQGAPFDLFLSADIDRAEFLEQNGFVVDAMRSTYARGRLVVVTQKVESNTRISEFDSRKLLSPFAQLREKQFSRLAMANPDLAPYGLAAKQVLEEMQIRTNQGELIYGENISQAFHFFQLAKTDLALLSLSQVLDVGLSPDQYEEIPIDLYHPIEQQMVLLKKRNQAERDNDDGAAYYPAMGLYHYLLSEDVQTMIMHKGYFAL